MTKENLCGPLVCCKRRKGEAYDGYQDKEKNFFAEKRYSHNLTVETKFTSKVINKITIYETDLDSIHLIFPVTL